MHRWKRGDDDDPADDEDDEELDEEEEEEPRPRRRGRPHGRKGRQSPPRRPHPIRRWRAEGDHEEEPGESEEEEDEEFSLEAARQRAQRPRTVYWRFRDSFLFVPLVAILVVIIVLGGLVAFTQAWPPVYVVDSNSMQHGSNYQLGVINAGDLVLSQKVTSSTIQTYVAATATGYRTYGELGDVILYQPNDQAGVPVVHRALLYLTYNPLNGTYNASSLAGLPCGHASPHPFYTVRTSGNACGAFGMTGTLVLFGIGWQGASVWLNLTPAQIGTHSGFVTLGDNNFQNPGCAGSACQGVTDQSDGLSQLVSSTWIVGVARGLIPWFGSLRLLLNGNAGAVPVQSWELMAVTLVAVVVAAFTIHYAWSSHRPADRRRTTAPVRNGRDEEREPDEEEEEPPRRRWFRSRALEGEEEGSGRSHHGFLHRWTADEPDDDTEEEEAHARTRSRRSGREGSGRPRPSVRRYPPSARTGRHGRNDRL